MIQLITEFVMDQSSLGRDFKMSRNICLSCAKGNKIHVDNLHIHPKLTHLIGTQYTRIQLWYFGQNIIAQTAPICTLSLSTCHLNVIQSKPDHGQFHVSHFPKTWIWSDFNKIWRDQNSSCPQIDAETGVLRENQVTTLYFRSVVTSSMSSTASLVTTNREHLTVCYCMILLLFMRSYPCILAFLLEIKLLLLLLQLCGFRLLAPPTV